LILLTLLLLLLLLLLLSLLLGLLLILTVVAIVSIVVVDTGGAIFVPTCISLSLDSLFIFCELIGIFDVDFI